MNPHEVAHTGVLAYAPGSIGNLGPGLDVLGCALSGAGDEVQVWWSDVAGVRIVDSGSPELPADADRHACGIAAQAVLARTNCHDRGIELSVRKGLPLSAGQGGSGASAIAGAVAVNGLLQMAGLDFLDDVALLAAALESESRLAGRHLDNLAASLLGGVVCVRHIDPPDVSRVPVAMPLWFALAHPGFAMHTSVARAVLPEFCSRDVLVTQVANVASLVNALATGDHALLGRALDDHVAEPARATLVPAFADAKRAALDAGALGVSLSGSGPTTFAACASEAEAQAAAEAMRWAYEASGVSCTTRVATIDTTGATWRALS
jgi:homoserine kinase